MKRKLAEVLVDETGGYFMNILPNVDLRMLEMAMDGLHKKVIEARVRAQIELENKAVIIDPVTGQKAINLKKGNGNGKKDSRQVIRKKRRDESQGLHEVSAKAHASPAPEKSKTS